jgi:outer membrane autotransporter protein
MNIVRSQQAHHVFLRGGRLARIGKRVVSYAPVLGVAVAVTLGMPLFAPGAFMTPALANCLVNGAPAAAGTSGADTVVCDAANNPDGLGFDALGGDDVIDLNSGTWSGRITGGAGNDTITLNGATLINTDPSDSANLTGRINGGVGEDIIHLESGTADWVAGNDGNDFIYLKGATITRVVAGNDGEDVISWTSGTLSRLSGGDGSDTVTITAAEYNSTQEIFGGNANDEREGDDRLTFDGVISRALSGTVSGWQHVFLENGSEIGLRGGPADFVLIDNINIAAGSTLLATEGLTLREDLSSQGTVDLSSGVAGTVLEVGGNFAGGGSLIIDAALGGSPQFADYLHIMGDATGTTRLIVNIAGAAGVETTGDGVLVVRVDGTAAADAFVLPGPLVSGAYTYVLDQGGAADSNQNFYLVSLGVNPDGELYSVAPALISSAFADLPGLVRRYAGRVEAGQSVSREGAGLQAVSRETAGFSTNFASGPLLGAPGPWVQIEAGRDRAQSDDDAQFETDRYAIKAGFDADAELWGPGRLIAGAYLSFGRSEETVDNPLGSASMTSDAYGVGLTATYYAGNGSYVDLQGQVMRIDSDLDVKSGVLSTAAAGSIELGHMISLANGASLIPSLQYQYGSVNASSFTDDLGSRITDFGDEASTGRVGVALQTPVMDGPVLTASIDYIHEFSPEVGVTVGAAEVSGDLPENWIEGGLGLDWQVGEASYINLRASYAGAIGEDLADNSSLNASVNFSVAF